MAGLEEMIGSFRALEQLEKRTAEIAVEKLRESLKASASSGASPDGNGWAPKKDGGRAMTGAAAHVDVRAIGSVVRVTLTGPDVFHHFSKKKSEPRRPVIPDAGGALPDVVSRALDEATAQAFDEAMRGKR